ncbi:hypothetical protein [uncultured Desulfosarcina sp.]|uniref:hypothetical protein n=1 Tax=uncultured Desulfosarcina sp. TaxID=218289 RepID=UPI0029C698FE|nr:hypothetical protein [uncultured Desulfosarcina sp.]
MKKDKPNTPSTTISRRTGIDRRWIPSANHQPERRRSRDRRTIGNRSFLEPFELNGTEETRKLFPEIKFPTSRPEMTDAPFSFDEKGFSAPREAATEKDVSEGG